MKHANGWDSFFQNIDLFGTKDLCGNEKMDYALSMLGAIPAIVFDSQSYTREDLLPIACALEDKDLFLLVRSRDENIAGEIVWLAGEEVDTFTDFDEFFIAMIEYNRLEAESLKKMP